MHGSALHEFEAAAGGGNISSAVLREFIECCGNLLSNDFSGLGVWIYEPKQQRKNSNVTWAAEQTVAVYGSRKMCWRLLCGAKTSWAAILSLMSLRTIEKTPAAP